MRGWLLAGLFFLVSTHVAASLRVVSLAPFLTEIVIMLEASDSLVGVLDDGRLPEELGKVTRVGGHQSLSLERIVAQKPDLVLAWTSGNAPVLLKQLESMGITVLRFDPRRLEEITDATLHLGQALGVPDRGEALAEAYAESLAAMHVPMREDAPRVFIQLWEDPLYTVSGSQLLSHALNHCGAENVFEGLPGLAPQVGREGVLGADPDMIIVLSDSPEAAQVWLGSWRRYPHLAAVRAGQLHALASDRMVRPTPRILEGLDLLCKLVQSR